MYAWYKTLSAYHLKEAVLCFHRNIIWTTMYQFSFTSQLCIGPLHKIPTKHSDVCGYNVTKCDKGVNTSASLCIIRTASFSCPWKLCWSDNSLLSWHTTLCVCMSLTLCAWILYSMCYRQITPKGLPPLDIISNIIKPMLITSHNVKFHFNCSCQTLSPKSRCSFTCNLPPPR